MNDFFTPWIKTQHQMLDAHRANIETAFKAMDKAGFQGAAKAAREIGEAQIDAWKKWLALWGPRNEG